MDRNEKIVAAMTAAVTVGSATLFAIKRLMGTNPRQPTEADLLTILEAAY